MFRFQAISDHIQSFQLPSLEATVGRRPLRCRIRSYTLSGTLHLYFEIPLPYILNKSSFLVDRKETLTREGIIYHRFPSSDIFNHDQRSSAPTGHGATLLYRCSNRCPWLLSSSQCHRLFHEHTLWLSQFKFVKHSVDE